MGGQTYRWTDSHTQIDTFTIKCFCHHRFDGKSQATQNVKPTHTVTDKLTIHEAGIELELYHAPGETSDQASML
jgi:hypothetical protein